MRNIIMAGALAAFAVGCSSIVDDAADEAQPIDTGDSVVAEGLVDCSERQDTGYTQGNPFTITVVTVDGKPLEVSTANAYVVMQEAAQNDGVGLRVVSGFRTMAEQQYLYGCYQSGNCNNGNLAAQPGYSNHQSGHAIDLNTSDGGVLDWLNNHGGDYGFARTVPSEVWHWEWWGGGPGGGPCGADAQCVADHNFGGCNGTVITSCDANNHVGSGDCGAFGAGCSTEGGAPHCVHPLCLIHLAGGEDGSFCTDATKIGTCALGVYSEGDCGAYAASCSENNGAHCVDFRCGIDDGTYCASAGVQATCTHGAYSEAACGDGTTCDDANGACAGATPTTEPPPSPTPVDGTGVGDPSSGTGANGGAHGAHGAALPPSVTSGCAASGAGTPATLLALAVFMRARKRRRASIHFHSFHVDQGKTC